MDKIRVAVTMGDPSGIGPEIVLKALSTEPVTKIPLEVVVFGDATALALAEELTGLRARFQFKAITSLDRNDLLVRKPNRACGAASLEFIKEAVSYVLKGSAHALVTAPISKEAIHVAGATEPGHTEMLRRLTKVPSVAMMFEGPRLRVVLATIHAPLSEVPTLLTTEKLLQTIIITHAALKELFLIEAPAVALAGLNPHAGEGGVLGREEIDLIAPAVARARAMGIDVQGPFPADTLFHRALDGLWDAVIAMYHDQGLAPFKMLHFDTGVNVTLGLPFVRTSPDHGTAFDIAWSNVANPKSMACAIETAARLTMNKVRARSR